MTALEKYKKLYEETPIGHRNFGAYSTIYAVLLQNDASDAYDKLATLQYTQDTMKFNDLYKQAKQDLQQDGKVV